MRVATYARASTDKQELSVSDQKESTRHYCARNPQWRIVAEIEDVKSGKYARTRPGFQELKRRVKNGEFDVVLIDDLSRLSRKFRHILTFADLCKQHRVTIHSVTKGELSKVLLLALGLAAEMQLDTGSDQVRRALTAKLRRGLRIAGVPFGYKAAAVDGEKGHMVVDKAQARQVVRMFRLAATGMSLLDICHILNSENVPPPRSSTWKTRTLSRNLRSSDGKTVLRVGILHNPLYYGENLANRLHKGVDAETEVMLTEIRPDTEWLREPGRHKKIILKELFDKVQTVRSAAAAKVFPPASGKKALLTDKIFCVACGGKMIRSGTGAQGRHRLVCRASVFYDRLELCTNSKSHYADAVENAVLLALTSFLSSHESAFQTYLDAHNAARVFEAAKASKTASALQEDVDQLRKQIDNLVMALANDGDHATLNPVIANLKKKREAAILLHRDAIGAGLTFKIDKTSVEGYRRSLQSLILRLKDGNGLDASDEGLAARLRTLIDRVVIHSAPKHKQGFKVEIFSRVGDLVAVNAGGKSQTSDTSQMASVIELQNWARANLVIEIPTSISDEVAALMLTPHTKLRPAREALIRILAEAEHPMVTPEIIPLLKDQGIQLFGGTRLVHLTCRLPEVVNLRGSGFWLRERPYPLVGYDPMTPDNYDQPMPPGHFNNKRLPRESEALSCIEQALLAARRPMKKGELSLVLSASGFGKEFSHPIYGIVRLVKRNTNIIKAISLNVYWLRNIPLDSRMEQFRAQREILQSILQSICDEMQRPLDKYELFDLMKARGFTQSWSDVATQLPHVFIKSGLLEYKKGLGWWPTGRHLPRADTQFERFEVSVSEPRPTFWLSDEQWRRIEFELPTGRRGFARVEDRRILSGIFYAVSSGAKWSDLPSAYGHPRTLASRFERWSRRGIFDRLFDATVSIERTPL